MSTSYFLRLTPRNPTCLDAIRNIIDPLSYKYVISQEETPRVHYHICMWCHKSIENLRYHLKQRVDGQIYISGKDIEDKINAIAYTIKDGNYVHRNLDITEFLLANAVTKRKLKFDDLIDQLKDEYNPSTMSDQTLVRKILEIYTKCKRKPYKQHIRALYDTIKLSKDSRYIDRMVEQIICNY